MRLYEASWVFFDIFLLENLLGYGGGGVEMKPIYREVILAAVLGLLLPAVVLDVALKLESVRPPVATVAPAEDYSYDGKEMNSGDSPRYILLRDQTGATEETGLEEYLVGVLLAELPVNFDKEAKKAQAVVARTYAWKAFITGGKHGDGSVCEDPACCQAYILPEQYLEKGGVADGITEARLAVKETAGEVLIYEGELIEATYFSCSGGSTEDAVAVWGTDFPYLRATDSPGEEGAAHYTDTATFSKEELEAALGVSLEDDAESWVGFTTYTAGDGVNTMCIGGKDFPGTQLRKLLGLRSTAFTVLAGPEGMTFVTRGYGHRVGMSQYGAEAMAVSGSTYRDILAHYYKGTELVGIGDLVN